MPRPTPAERRLRRKLAANVRRFRMAIDPDLRSIQKVAERASMHWRHLQKIEGAEVGVTLRTLARLAEALEVEAHDLLK